MKAKSVGDIVAIGAMSGTSMDGVDLAVVESDGVTIQGFGPVLYHPFTDNERAVLRSALGTWPGEDGADSAARLVEAAHIAAGRDLMAELAAHLAEAEADAPPDTPPETPSVSGPATLFGFHGQTLAHDPRGRGTHQAGDGASLAKALDLPVIWDFRANDIEMGGEGAPLAPFFHWALARWIEATRPLAFLNLGGVGNLTWVDPAKDAPEDYGALLAFDTGPANAPMDDLMARRGLGHFDHGGALARQGRVDEAGVAEFMLDGYFHRMPPKSLDRDAFSYLTEAVSGLETPDALATLAACAAASVARGLEHFRVEPERILVTGGGRHNAALMAQVAQRTGLPVAPVETVGLNGDALEAQAFAYLAIRVAKGLPTSAPGTTGVAAPIGGGRRSEP